jgi:magnesium chelatase subunit D
VARAGQAAGLLAAQGVAAVVLDCESGHVRLGLAHTLAAQLSAQAVTLDELRADGVAALVHAHRSVDRSDRSDRSERKAA